MIVDIDSAIVGGGAAGLMSAIWSGRSAPRGTRIVLLDGAKSLGAKILVAGGGRCNVTHRVVSERDYAGSTPAAIRKVLRSFPVAETIGFFRELGLELKTEETGKLFPVTDQARTVLDALLRGCAQAGVELRCPWRVEEITREPDGRLRITGEHGTLLARRVVLATGGRSLPKTGSDGQGYEMARALGHTLTKRLTPALVPLTLPRDHFITRISGLTASVRLELRRASGKRLATSEGSMLCTHFGVSGPVVLDISRHYLAARADDPGTTLRVNWLPSHDFASVEDLLQASSRGEIGGLLAEHLPRRLAAALCAEAGVDPARRSAQLTRAARRALAHTLLEMPLPVTGDRGYTHAEVTAGGVPLSELNLATMESRCCPGLHLCGEICDVDGRIGGFNFQWAWASGYLAGRACGAPAPSVSS